MSEGQSLMKIPKPYGDESLAGYVLRLTEANFYEKVSYIYLMADLWEIVIKRSKNGNLLNPFNDNMKKLSELINCSIKDLADLTFASNDTFFQYKKEPIPRQAIHTTNTKICPKCLAEIAYHRKVWDLVPVTTCIKHQLILIDRCPKCERRISWSRPKVLECSCGQLLSEIPSEHIGISESPISILFSKSNAKYLREFPKNPLKNFRLLDLFEVIVFFSWFKSKNEKWKLRNKFIGKSLSNQEIHHLFSSVYKIFDDWPNNFIKFLDDIQESAQKQTDDSSIENYFGYFYTALYKHLDKNKNTKFLIVEFDEYLAKRWDGGYIATLRKSSSKSLDKKYLAAIEVWKLYGIPQEAVKKYVRMGIFNGIIKKRGNSTLILVEKESVQKYKQKIDNTFSSKETSEVLGIYSENVHELRKFGFISAIRGPKVDGYPNWRYSIDSVYGLLEEVCNKVPATVAYTNENDLIIFKIALQIAGSLKFGIGQLMKGILENDIKPIRLVKGEGLYQLELYRDEVRNYFLKLRANKDNEYITLREMVKITGVKRDNIADWMKKGLLDFVVGETEEYKSTKQEFDFFLRTYVPLSIVAKQLNTNSRSLYQKLLNDNIVALTGPRVDGGKQYLYLKEEIDNNIIKVRGKEFIQNNTY